MTFETLSANLKEAQHSVSLAHHHMQMAESMADAANDIFWAKSISEYEAALDKANSIRQQMSEQYDADLLAMDIRCGRK